VRDDGRDRRGHHEQVEGERDDRGFPQREVVLAAGEGDHPAEPMERLVPGDKAASVEGVA
jgi:hypothetical protein